MEITREILLKKCLESINRLKEAGGQRIDVNDIFNAFVSKSAEQEAEAKWGPKAKTQEGQKEILEAARNQDYSAVNYLYTRLKGTVFKVFWTYLVGDKSFTSEKINSGQAAEFATEAYMMLAGQGNSDPYKTFNPDIFDEKADLINQFNYYYMRYLQSEAFKIIRKYKKGGFSGNRDLKGAEEEGMETAEPSVASYDQFFQNSDETATEDFSDESTIGIVFDDFEKWLRENKSETFAQIWSMVRDGLKFTEIASKLGMKRPQMARNYYMKIVDLFKQQHPELNPNK